MAPWVTILMCNGTLGMANTDLYWILDLQGVIWGRRAVCCPLELHISSCCVLVQDLGPVNSQYLQLALLPLPDSIFPLSFLLCPQTLIRCLGTESRQREGVCPGRE